jgi:hypothetical protein
VRTRRKAGLVLLHVPTEGDEIRSKHFWGIRRSERRVWVEPEAEGSDKGLYGSVGVHYLRKVRRCDPSTEKTAMNTGKVIHAP